MPSPGFGDGPGWRRRNTEAIDLLLDRGADVHAMANDGETPLTAAASIEPYGDVHGKSAECTALLLKRGASPNSSVRGMTALMDATMEGNLKVMSLLLDHGASINAGDGYGSTALMWAGSEGQADAVRLLLARGVAMKDSCGRPFLVLPSEQGCVLLVGCFPDEKKTGSRPVHLRPSAQGIR
ncbi:MAG: ankyrin repeat domain-containing protein [Desulfovibrio sp.]|nr:ankyrin repeat domain-containing protein [Desulfovibrio sp.]